MGENEDQNSGFGCKVFGEKREQTNNQDTMDITKQIVDAGVDLLVFCGGDGKARDVLNAVDKKVPVLGDIPFIGQLFRSRQDRIDRTNLIIFITARVVS